MSDKQQPSGPCSYKSACKNCRFTLETERPTACVELSCEYYTPCKACGANTSLRKNGKCRQCGLGNIENDNKVIVRGDDGFELKSISDIPSKKRNLDPSQRLSDVSLDPVVESVVNEIRNDGTIVIEDHNEFSEPGTPPGGLTDPERKYYTKQWNRYSEYYPDPTLESTLHTIIVIELELLWITSRVARARGEYDTSLMSQRSRLTSDIKSLRSSLPEEEANEMSDKEASLSYAYEQYAAERAKNSLGGADRIFTKDAVALNASLPFKTDLKYILEKLGYAEGSVRSILDSVTDLKEKTPFEVATLFGFNVSKEFAMDDGFSGAEFEASLEDSEGQ